MDTMGDEATYTWVLETPKIRVSLGDQDSDTYFQATLNADNSEYVGTWHYPEGDRPDSTENIVYAGGVQRLGRPLTPRSAHPCTCVISACRTH
jgi:hypothetical protein